jgi:hypothetical protein
LSSSCEFFSQPLTGADVAQHVHDWLLLPLVAHRLLDLGESIYRRAIYADPQAGFVIWGLDRFVSFGKFIIANKIWLFPTKRREECRDCLVELLTEDVMRLTMDRPFLRWGPGQHA